MSTLARAPSKREIYDCIVVGSQLGGQVAAAMLAKRGHRVLVIDHDGLDEGYPDGGFVLPYAPALWPPLRSIPAAEAVFQELGIHTDLGRLLAPRDPELQILLPGHRFDLARDPTARRRELARELVDPEAASAIWSGLCAAPDLSDGFLRAPEPFPAQGFWARRALARRARALPDLGKALAMDAPQRHPLAALARALAPFASYLHQEPVAGLALSRALGLLLRGPHRLPGGREGLRLLIRKRLDELGGRLLGSERPAVVEEIAVSGKRAAGIKLVDTDAVYLGRAVISATDTAALRRLFPPQARRRGLSEQLDAVRLRRFLLAVNLVLPAEQLPLGLAELGVLMPRDEALGPVLYEVAPAEHQDREAGKAVAEAKVICAAALVPAQARDLGDAHLEGLAHRIREAMLEVLPFARPLMVSVPMLAKGQVRGSRLSPHPVFEIDEEAQLGVSGVAVQTPLRNLFLASREVLPGLGLEGEFIAGSRAAALVQGLLKKKDPLT